MSHPSQQILVCIDAHPKTNGLLHAAANLAKKKQCSWAVLYVETPDHYALDSESRERILRFLTQAEAMGAKTHQIENPDVGSSILAFVQDAAEKGCPVTDVVMGEYGKDGFFAELKISLAEKVARRLRKYPIEMHVIPLSGKHYVPTWFERLQLHNVRLGEIVFACLSIFCAYLAAEILRANLPVIEWQINAHNVNAFFLIACIITSLCCGLIPGLIAAVLGFSTINYFYMRPLYDFGITHAADGISLSIFLLSAVVISLIGSISRASFAALRRKERRSQVLYDIHRLAARAQGREQVLNILHEELSRILEMEVAFFFPLPMDADRLELVYPKQLEFGENEAKLLQQCWNKVHTTGLGTVTLYDTLWRFEPLISPHGEIGVLGIHIPETVRLDASFGRLVTALADQSAAILERIELTRMMSESQVREEREKLRSMLLSSVSHDLKTPLASIIGSLSVYKRMQKAGKTEPEVLGELTDTALQEARRLDSFITNILDMTRIESGDIEFDRQWVPAVDPLEEIERRFHNRIPRPKLVMVPDYTGVADVEMDPLMTAQVLQNVVDNAIKYAPQEKEITISYGPTDEGFCYRVRDRGEGIPENKLETVFDKYERIRQSDHQVAGTGLGLAICRAIMEKQDGSIYARNHPEGGAEFMICLPRFRLSENQLKEAV